MRTITLHPVSVLVGCALAGLAVVVSGFQSQHPGLTMPVREVRLVGEIPAEWWTYVDVQTVASGTKTFTVPADRYFVVTRREMSGTLLANGQDVTLAMNGAAPGEQNPAPVAFAPGTLLAAGDTYVARLWGYLEPVR